MKNKDSRGLGVKKYTGKSEMKRKAQGKMVQNFNSP
jgi:hypothetical protein